MYNMTKELRDAFKKESNHYFRTFQKHMILTVAVYHEYFRLKGLRYWEKEAMWNLIRMLQLLLILLY